MNLLDKIKRIIKIGTDNDQSRNNWLKQELGKVPPGLRILDAGAGERKNEKFCSHLNYIAQDFAQYNGKGDGVGLQTGEWNQNNLDIVSDITEIPEKDESFDVILCTEVFEHIPEPLLAIEEFSRLLKKGGKLIITAPFASGTHFAPFHFYSGFSYYFYKTHLEKNNFKIIEISRTGNFFKYIAQEVRRIPFMVKKYTRTKLRLWEYPFLVIFLLILKRLNKSNINSEEFLNFDYCVVAEKNKLNN